MEDYELLNILKKKVFRSILVGLAWLICGILLTAISYDSAVNNNGGIYFIARGPIVFGVIWTIRGLVKYSKINKVTSNKVITKKDITPTHSAADIIMILLVIWIFIIVILVAISVINKSI